MGERDQYMVGAQASLCCPRQRDSNTQETSALQRQSPVGEQASPVEADWHLCPQHIQEFTNETWWARTGWPLPDHLVLLVWSLIVSLYPLGGLFGALLAGPFAIKLGR